MTTADKLDGKSNRWHGVRKPARVLLWVTGIPAVLIVALYTALWISPIPASFIRDRAEIGAAEALPANIKLDFGDAVLTLEKGLWPIVRFTPVELADIDAGANIKMDALEVGFSPLRAIFGQPGVSVTMVRPHIQIIQDLFGPRLAGFELVDDQDGNDATIWVMEGEKSLPSVRISSEGLDVRGFVTENKAAEFRSDNDWLIYNLIATEEGLAAFDEQARHGKFSRLRVRDGILEMHDSVYGLFRQFSDLQLDMAQDALGEGIHGKFSGAMAGRSVRGSIARTVNANGGINISTDVEDIDYATLLPFIDDPDGLMAVRGVGALGMSVDIAADGTTIEDAEFAVDLSGTSLRIDEDLFPVTTENLSIKWDPETAKFTVDSASVTIGQSSADLSGVIIMGLDDVYGPTLSLALSAKNVFVHPYDMDAPTAPFEEVAMSGWSAPLYGAVGIDQLIVQKPGMLLRTKGRADMLRAGIGFQMEVGGTGASADDLKRLWPYFLSSNAREWFVQSVSAGTVENAEMRFDFPVGTVAMKGEEDKPTPPGGLSIDMIGTNVEFVPLEGMDPIKIAGETRLQVRDAMTTVNLDGANMSTQSGPVDLSDVAFIIDTAPDKQYVYEISGKVDGQIAALLDVIEANVPDALDGVDLPIDPKKLSGDVSGALVATYVLQDDGTLEGTDYAANGTITDFTSEEPIEGFNLNKGQLAFNVTPAGYSVDGEILINEIDAEIGVSGTIDGEPELVASSTLSVEQLKSLGFDASEYMGGDIKIVAKPLANGVVQVAADLKGASLTVTDLGLSKAAGVDGSLQAEILQSDTKIEVGKLNVAFADVDLRGSLTVDQSTGLETAEFTTFKLSPGDDASLSVAPKDNGFALRLRGNQLDLKPMLRRFFALDQVSTGGPQSTQFDQAIDLDVELKQALGFYQVIGYNLDMELALVGEDLRNVSMQAQFAQGSSVSVTTNPIQGGRTMSVAVNDAGTLLRFLNVYPRLLGGQGSLSLTHSTAEDIDRGTLRLRNFSIVDEAKVVEVLGNHRDSRELVASQNRLNFNDSSVDFIRRSDRIEVVDSVLDGTTTGGTMRGFIYTKAREYDLAGTYIPLFALNNIFQKLPIIGDLLGGRDGEGLVGVTFAIRGNLDNPDFLINPASLLLPGAFRSIMEFRANEAPRELQ